MDAAQSGGGTGKGFRHSNGGVPKLVYLAVPSASKHVVDETVWNVYGLCVHIGINYVQEVKWT